VADAIRGQAADVCIVRYPARHQEWFRDLVRQLDEVLLADTLVYWSHQAVSTPSSGVTAVQAEESPVDLGTVDDLVQRIFAGYGNHYAANRIFPARLVLDGYREWAASSARDGDAVVLDVAGQPAALATLASTNDVCEVLLAGVVPEHQGGGHYARLLADVERRARSAGNERLVISTQGHNVNVQKAWVRAGFEPAECFLTLHVMRRGAAPLSGRSSLRG